MPDPKIYTRAGDRGQTGLLGGVRVPKDSPRPEVYGTTDELNALLGLVRCEKLPEPIDRTLGRIQHELFQMGAELAAVDPQKLGLTTLGPDRVEQFEQEIDWHEAQLPPLKQFILPGGARSATLLHQARTVCRRAERRLVALDRQEPDRFAHLLVYLNRLGDLLFVLARAANRAAGVDDLPWQPPRPTA